MILCEVCVEGVQGALAAEEGGAHRIELCAALVEGGTTPSDGTLSLVLERLSIPTMVLVRPRGGDFLYSDGELEVMLRDIRRARELGAHGVATGALTREGTVDRDATARLRDAAGDLSMTFHRAFDMTRDPFESLEILVELGVDRVLTSGQHESVLQGAELVRRLVEHADGRIGILPGAGIREDNVAQLIVGTGVEEVHFTAMMKKESGMLHRNPLPRMGATRVPGEFELSPTDPQRVRAMVKAAQGATE